MLVLVETRREQLRHSKSVVFTKTKEYLSPIFNSLDEAYAVVGVSLRAQMKVFKQRGLEALRDLEDFGRLCRNNPALAKRIAAAVTAAANAKT